MVQTKPVPSDDPALNHSKLLKALELTLRYAIEHDGIGLTKSNAFNRKFATWAAENFGWPGYSVEELLRIQKVLNEEDVLPVWVIHDLLVLGKLGRHIKGRFKPNKRAYALLADRSQLFEFLIECFMFGYDHSQLSRRPIMGLGNWDVFLNVINVEARNRLTEAHLVKTLYGLEQSKEVYDREYQDHALFLPISVLRPLEWMGLLRKVSAANAKRSESIYLKTPLWAKLFDLPTDHIPASASLN